MRKKKLKYTPPIMYDLTHAVKDEVDAPDCVSGGYAVTICDLGVSAGVKCAFGRYAESKCWTGDNPGMPRCYDGYVAGALCQNGEVPGQNCLQGGTYVL